MLGGWPYQAAFMDRAGGKCLGWALAGHRGAKRATDALKMVIGRWRPSAG